MQLIPESSVLAVATAAAALALPPTSYAILPEWWSSDGVVPEIELEVWTDAAAVNLTAAVLYGATLHPFTFADAVTTSASSVTNKLTKAAHGLLTGDGPVRLTTVAGLPAPLLVGTDYWVIKSDANTFYLATSFANALAGTAIDLTTNGTDATVVASASTRRAHWQTHDGLLGLAGDGAIALTLQLGYRKRVPHSPRVVAYALVATLDAATCSAAIVPVVDR